tara:strand:- start:1102 stop:1818 length:717 start_codon:yes stop_codon:yes gene_type:complete
MNHEEYKTMSKSSSAVAVANNLVASTDTLPAHLKLVEGVGRGNENVGANVQIPRIKLLQKMSNEVDKHHASFVDGCEPGHMVNTLTNHNYGNDLYVLSLHFKTEFVVWRHLDAGGGYLGAFSSVAEAEAKVNEQDKPSEYDINETHAHVILIKNPETGELERSPAIMDFASSKLRVSKAWNSQIAMKGGDRFNRLVESLWRTYREQDGQGIYELRSLVCWLGSRRRLQDRRRSLRSVL